MIVKTNGAVRGSVLKEGKNPTVRVGAVNRTEPHRTDRKNRTVKNPGFKDTGRYILRTYAKLSIDAYLFDQYSYVSGIVMGRRWWAGPPILI